MTGLRNFKSWKKSLQAMWARLAYLSYRCTEDIQNKITIMPNGHLVSRCSDYIIYSVEAEHIENVVSLYGPCKI